MLDIIKALLQGVILHNRRWIQLLPSPPQSISHALVLWIYRALYILFNKMAQNVRLAQKLEILYKTTNKCKNMLNLDRSTRVVTIILDVCCFLLRRFDLKIFHPLYLLGNNFALMIWLNVKIYFFIIALGFHKGLEFSVNFWRYNALSVCIRKYTVCILFMLTEMNIAKHFHIEMEKICVLYHRVSPDETRFWGGNKRGIFLRFSFYLKLKLELWH